MLISQNSHKTNPQKGQTGEVPAVVAAIKLHSIFGAREVFSLLKKNMYLYVCLQNKQVQILLF